MERGIDGIFWTFLESSLFDFLLVISLLKKILLLRTFEMHLCSL